MQNYEYKVIPAPRQAKRAKGVKGVPARFAHAVSEAMNELAADGWEYVKSETLPMDAPKGMLGGKVEAFQSLLVFRREIPGAQADDDSIGYLAAAAAAAPVIAAADVVALPEELEHRADDDHQDVQDDDLDAENADDGDAPADDAAADEVSEKAD